MQQTNRSGCGASFTPTHQDNIQAFCICGHEGYCIKCIKQMQEEIIELTKWKEALLDAGVVNWVLNESNKNNPRDLINNLLHHEQKLALDPAVSSEVQQYIDIIKLLQEALHFIASGHDRLKGFVDSVIKISNKGWTDPC